MKNRRKKKCPRKQWEYRVEVSKVGNGGHDEVETEHLNELGRRGWRLISHHILSGLEFEHRIFIRRKRG